MMKHLKTLFFILSCLMAGCEATMAQRSNDQLPAGSTPSTMNGYLVNRTDTTAITGRELWLYFGGGLSSRAVLWNDMKVYVASASPVITQNTISSLPSIGDSPGSGLTVAQWIVAEFYKSQVPTAALGGGFSQERVASGANLTATLSWTAGRQAATQPLATIVVNGITQTFSQPSAPGTVGGTQSVSYARNTSSSFSMTVTTTDSKTAGASTGFSFYDKRYAGFDAHALVSGVPAQADILAASFQDANGGNTNLSRSEAQQGSNLYYFFITTGTVSSVVDRKSVV